MLLAHLIVHLIVELRDWELNTTRLNVKEQYFYLQVHVICFLDEVNSLIINVSVALPPSCG